MYKHEDQDDDGMSQMYRHEDQDKDGMMRCTVVCMRCTNMRIKRRNEMYKHEDQRREWKETYKHEDGMSAPEPKSWRFLVLSTTLFCLPR